ncbi:hypothetical protein B0H14DRAFT_2306468, partial [Mycena olivaceomarginata]
LPVELERYILELAASSRPVSIPKLMLVARHVKEWVEPLLYHTLAISDYQKKPIDGYAVCSTKTILSSIQVKPASFFQRSVRQLFLDAGLCHIDYRHTSLEVHQTIPMILAVCTGVENLWIWIPFSYMIPLVPLIAKLPLKQLHAVAQPIFIQLQSDHPLFSQLTHLELDGASTSWGEFGGNWSCLSLLPRLTHLAFVDWAFLGTFPELLRSCKSLSALILLEAVNNG